MKTENSNNSISDSEFDETFSLRPAFRIFSRRTETLGWAEYFKSKPIVAYPKHSVIVAQGENNPNIYYLRKGLVEFTNIDENGSESILEILGPGNMLNLSSAFGQYPSIASFVTLSDSSLSFAMKSEILSMIRTNTALAQELLEEMAFIIGGLNRWSARGAERSDLRAQRVIYMIAVTCKDDYKEGESINIKLSQTEFARIIQTTRVTISKILADLKRKGIIETDYGGISITNMALLTKLVKDNSTL